MTALQTKLKELLRLNAETEWVEFKHDNDYSQLIGEYISALANGAALHGQPFGYLVWGIEDGTHRIVGTSFHPKQAKVKQEELENWLLRQLNPRIEVMFHQFELDGLPVALLEIQAARTAPVSFKDERYIRVGSYKQKLHDFPEKSASCGRSFLLGNKIGRRKSLKTPRSPILMRKPCNSPARNIRKNIRSSRRKQRTGTI